MAGNKGAVAIRMDYANTSICLVTAHLAAGFANYEERNQDYKTISHGLRFQRNRTIEDHDTIIWLGDFNYRIGMSNERTRALVKQGDLDMLYANDQLNLQMVHGKTFPFYNEARITFLPTYKYDLGTDEYDSSDKARIPAWCDRILTKGNNLRQIHYDTAPLRFSDHRPVWGNFQCTVTVVDEKKKEAISEQLYRQRRGVVGDSTANTHAEETDDEDLLGYESIEPGLPPASSDRRKWWLDGGQPARSRVQPPGPGYTHNPASPANPFTPTSEPDWVKVDRPASPLPLRPANNGSTESLARKQVPLRKLPPPWQGPNSGSGSSANNHGNNRPEPQQTASALSSANSMQSSNQRAPSYLSKQATLRKPAPPLVPKKPALLRSESNTASSPAATAPAQHKQQERYRDFSPPPAQRVGKSAAGGQGINTPSSMAANSVPFPPPPRRSATLNNSSSGGGGGGMNQPPRFSDQTAAAASLSRSASSAAAPSPPPPRRLLQKTASPKGGSSVSRGRGMGMGMGGGNAGSGTADQEPTPRLPPRGSTSVNLMDDEEAEGAAKGWAALRPGQ